MNLSCNIRPPRDLSGCWARHRSEGLGRGGGLKSLTLPRRRIAILLRGLFYVRELGDVISDGDWGHIESFLSFLEELFRGAGSKLPHGNPPFRAQLEPEVLCQKPDHEGTVPVG